MKIWIILGLLALGMALVPSCKEKSQVSSRVIVTALGIDAADGKEGLQLSVQSVEPLLTSGSLTEQQENATAVYGAQGSLSPRRSIPLFPLPAAVPSSCTTA